MMIDNLYNDKSAALINPDIYKLDRAYCDTAIMTFSHLIIEKVVEKLQPETVVVHQGLNDEHPIYLIHHNGHNIGLFMLTLGASGAAVSLEEGSASLQAHRFVMFGSCGCLDTSINSGTVIIPNKALRNEGTSFQYQPASEWIDIPGYMAVEKFMKEAGISYKVGPTWTTDGLYRETADLVNQRRQQGCITADMEVSALQAVCNWRHYEYYPFLYGADNLDTSGWDQRIFGQEAEKDSMLASFNLALKLAETLDK
jgi:uridine phosphorylase